MPLIPSPSQQRRRPSGRAALLVVGALLGAFLLPSPAEAVLLWKRKKAQGQQTAPAAGPATPAHSSMAADPLGGSPDLAATGAAALDAPVSLPHPGEVANYPHELRLLQDAHSRLANSSGRARAVALLEYGNALARINRDGAAGLAYSEALALDPGLQPAWNNLGSLLRRKGHLELAGSIFRSVLAEDPEAGLAWFNLAMTVEAQGDWDGADHAYLQALTFSPELWVPSQNPLIIGNDRAQQALHRRYLAHGGRGSIYLDDAR